MIVVSDTAYLTSFRKIFESHDLQVFDLHETDTQAPSIETITNILVSSPRVVVNLLENAMAAAYLTAMLKDLSVSYTGSDARVFLLTSNPNKVYRALQLEEIPVTQEAGPERYPLIIIGNCTKNRVIFGTTPHSFSVREAIEVYARQIFSLLEMQGYAYMTFTLKEEAPYVVDVSAALPKVLQVIQSRYDCDVKQMMNEIIESAYIAGRGLV